MLVLEGLFSNEYNYRMTVMIEIEEKVQVF